MQKTASISELPAKTSSNEAAGSSLFSEKNTSSANSSSPLQDQGSFFSHMHDQSANAATIVPKTDTENKHREDIHNEIPVTHHLASFHIM